jgi:hypothetical protein
LKLRALIRQGEGALNLIQTVLVTHPQSGQYQQLWAQLLRLAEQEQLLRLAVQEQLLRLAEQEQLLRLAEQEQLQWAGQKKQLQQAALQLPQALI